MTSLNRQSQSSVDQQQPVYMPDENSRSYTVMDNVPLTINKDLPQEQQIVYFNPPVNYLPINCPQSYVYPQQLPNGQIVNQITSTNPLAQQYHQQQNVPSYSNIPFTLAQQSMIHSNVNQQNVALSSYQASSNASAPSVSSMTNPTISSTPLSAQNKRGRNDISGTSESNVQAKPRYPQSTRVFSSNNMSYKRLRGIDQQYEGIYLGRNPQNLRNQVNQGEVNSGDNNQPQPSVAACRFATSRYPFSPFTVIFMQEVREKIVIDDLINHARNNVNFELKTVAYRRGRAENNECRILIFVENSESFAFLYNHDNWPTTLAGNQFTTKSPSIPPQLALVLPSVSLQIGWDEFVEEVKGNYPDIADIIRLKNKAQQPVRAVKLEFLSAKARSELLETGEIAAMHMKFKVVEYFSQANVLICSNCCGLGHFRKNCPQKEESTCKTCGDKCQNLMDHQCSRVPKCIHCGGPHFSNDQKCKVVKDYRAALTRNLLSKTLSNNMGEGQSCQTRTNMGTISSANDRPSFSTVVQMAPSNWNDVISKKLDSILLKVEEESVGTRQSLGELKEEMYRYREETMHRVEILETKIKTIEKKVEDLSLRTFTILQNICTSLLDPQSSEGTSWKVYWQDQIKVLKDYRSSVSTST